MLKSQDPANPYEVEFRHNSHGNTWGELADALVAFDLSDLPDTQGKTVKLKLNGNLLMAISLRNLIIVLARELRPLLLPFCLKEVF